MIAPSSPRDPALAGVALRLAAGERLTRADGLQLAATDDLLTLGRLADAARVARHGRRAMFVRNVHLNPTNVCRYTCRFCAFAVIKGGAGGYDMSRREIEDRLAPLAERGLQEVHIVGGVHPDWRYPDYLDRVRWVRALLPDVAIKAYTAVEIDEMVDLSGRDIDGVLADLQSAGGTMLPGGGAEVFAPAVRRTLCGAKLDGDGWLAIHRAAHQRGMPTNATLLYGHLEEPADRVDHLLALRALQDEAPAGGGFRAFVPLAFHPGGTRLAHLPAPGDRLGLRMVALSRLLLDNVPHITAYWVMLGERMAQLALSFGADDLSGTVTFERITHAAGGVSPRGLTPERMRTLIAEAGREPVERDGLYRPLAESAPAEVAA